MAGCIRYCVVRRCTAWPQASSRSKSETERPPFSASMLLVVGGSCLWSPTRIARLWTCCSATSSAASQLCVASSTTTASKILPAPSPAPSASAESESTPAPTSVQQTMSASRSTATLPSSRPPLRADLASWAARACIFVSKWHAALPSLTESRGPSRTIVGCQTLPSVSTSPSRSTRATISSTAQLEGAHTSSRTLVRPPPAPEPGIATFCGRLRVAKRAERRLSTTLVLPVPGGPCNSAKPCRGAASAQTASRWTALQPWGPGADRTASSPEGS
mmetsp:Transcript_3355/g.10087  ORF Transcript_3355/g.10087 Transcript_3355/m.10087 type:complete len:275 (-) Transcript_3355:274-1098(-)